MSHQPVIAPSTVPGVWNVYCDACSQDAHDYVYPCREGREFPPRQVRAYLGKPPVVALPPRPVVEDVPLPEPGEPKWTP